ncbi:MAG: His-Xaa-Ser system radical SAM maturase HxsB [Methylobacter sp.]|uniref:His-Xaa-Ser system radical SAM maturase HxsB n=1 Tax=Methylobacter sp. TaxID=2051955 RepID=UPI00272F9807|nr:His-Xaa-Ser system radical SAM maturase HxsB [Methylobacter sp.]MDP1666137.1 His-Xaa-Ser system radical SAM maturase HxsB [Methylobacter sp.]
MALLGKKFKLLEVFDQATNGQYQLLPSRFAALDDGRYLLSNEVGEYLVVTRPDLESFIRKQVPANTDFYHDLKSKHFLFDDDSNVALDLLALKYRTKAQRISQFTALHIFVISLRCDYTCQYCQVSRQTDDKHAFDMSEETANKALDLVFKSPSPAIKIEFQGGEPLLNFALIQYVVNEANRRNEKHQKDLQFVITTNLSLLNQEVLEFCQAHDIHLSTSLDGPENLHNTNRPRPGKNGYQLTVNGIKKAQSFLGHNKIGALMTTTEKSLPHVKSIIDTYLENNLDCIFLRPLSPYGFAIKNQQAHKYDVDRWFEFYKEGLDYVLEINRQGYQFVELYTQLIINKLLSPFSEGYVDLQSPTGAAISAIVYNYDGDVYASDEARMLAEMGNKKFRLGNVHTDDYEGIWLSDTLLDTLECSLSESIPMCNDCGFLPYCGTDPVYHYATQGDVVGHKALSGFCNKNMKIFKHIIHLLEDDPEARKILLTWVRT